MAAVIRIQIETTGDVGQVKKDIEDLGRSAESSGGGFNALQEIATGALRAIGEAGLNLAGSALKALGDAVSDGIADAKLNAQIQAQTAAVLKSTGDAAGVTADHIADYASALSDAAGKSLFGDDQIQQSENLLLTFTEIKGKTLDAATAISVDMAQALGGAPKDAAIQLGKALNDPINGITALSRVGVSFSDEQKEQITTMQQAGDTAGAQAIILAELNKEFGGSAEAAAQATGGWSELNGRLGEAKEAIGTALLPLLSQFAGFVITNVLPVIEDLAASFGPWLQVAIPQAIAGVQSFMAAMQPFIEFIEANIKPILAGLATILITVVVPAFVAWAISAGAAAIATIAALAPVLIPIAAIGAAVGLLVAAWDNDWGGIQEKTAAVWAFLEPTFNTVRDWLQIYLASALQALAIIWNDVLLPAISAVWAFLQNYIIPIISTLISVNLAALNLAIRLVVAIWNNELLPAITAIWKFIQGSLMPIVQTFITLALDPLMKSIHDIAFFILGTLTPWLQALGKEVSGPLAGAFEHMQNIANDAVGALRSIGSAVQSVIGWISDLIAKLSSVSIPDWLQGHSPPPMANWFSYIGDAVADLNEQLPTLQMNLSAGQVVPGGNSTSVSTTHNRPFSFAVNNYNAQNSEPMDMALAMSLAGV